MKPVKFRNKINGEQFVCNNIKENTKSIDGIEYYLVHREGTSREFLMRKDALEKVKH